jgi:parvulin-like peptidyl-prolyl isomerase
MPPRPVLILLILSLCGLTSPAQNSSRIPDDTLAEVGAGIITAGDLFERIELMPWAGKERRRTFDSSRVQALESLVAERLLASEAAERGIGFDTLMLLRLGGLEREFVRDELYRREVAGSVSVSPGEMEAGVRKYALLLRVVIHRCSSELTGQELSEGLRAESTPDSVASPGSGEGFLSRDTVTVGFGIADESLEDHAYALDPAHRVSAPYYSENLGWVVLLLVDAQTNPRYAQQDVAKQLSSVRDILRSRKARLRGREFMHSVLSPQKAVADRHLLGLLARSIYAIIMSDSAAHRSQGRFLLAPEEIDVLESDLRPDLGRELVSLPGGPLSLGAAIQAFRIEPFSSPSLGRNIFLSVLNESVKRIVEEELLAREGYRRHLQNSPSVVHDLAAWSDNWRALMLEQSIPGGEPGEEDEMEALIENGRRIDPSYEVDVREILSDSLSEALRCVDRLTGGADMSDLARRISRRPGWSGQGGESGFFHVRSYPELGIRALAADTGRLIGPVAVKGGYSVFRVLGRRGTAGDGGITLDSLRKLIRPGIRYEKRRHAVDRFIAGLAQKYGVNMYYDRLQKIDISRHNMFTRRLIGFGGMMNAAPVLKPEWGWVREYLRAKHQVP